MGESVKHERCEVEVPEGKIEGFLCPHNDEMYHRTQPRSLKKILDSGVLRVSEDTGVVSLSSSPDHTFGGTVRMVLDREKTDTTLQPMCYVDHRTESSDTLIKAEGRVCKESKEFCSPNKAMAKLGAAPETYASECEWFKRGDIPLPPSSIKRVEFWLSWFPRDFSVSCDNVSPKYITQHHTIDYRDLVKQTKKVADEHGIPFDVKSCFSHIKMPREEWVELNPENLSRIRDGKPPETFKLPWLEEPDTYCKC